MNGTRNQTSILYSLIFMQSVSKTFTNIGPIVTTLIRLVGRNLIGDKLLFSSSSGSNETDLKRFLQQLPFWEFKNLDKIPDDLNDAGILPKNYMKTIYQASVQSCPKIF